MDVNINCSFGPWFEDIFNQDFFKQPSTNVATQQCSTQITVNRPVFLNQTLVSHSHQQVSGMNWQYTSVQESQSTSARTEGTNHQSAPVHGSQGAQAKPPGTNHQSTSGRGRRSQESTSARTAGNATSARRTSNHPHVKVEKRSSAPKKRAHSPTSNKEAKKGKDEQLCSICLDSYLERNPVSTKCGHVYCKECILKLIEVKRRCPLCNAKISTRSTRPVYL